MEESSYWKRFNRRRISRRALLGAGGALALGSVGAVLVGCDSGTPGGGPGQTPTAGRSPVPAGSPQPGGSITFGRGVNVLGIDPHVDLTGADIDALMYTYLYSWISSVEQVVTNNFVTEMELPDPLHMNFTLRPGVINWPGDWPGAGEELTSEDCKASFERRGTAITAPDKRFPQRIQKIDTPDPYTFNLIMSRPFVPAVREMANFTWAIVSKKVLDAYPSLSQAAYGSGPFMLKEFHGAERIVLERHPNYFLSPRPYLDSLTYIVIRENSSLLSAFKSGQHDVNGSLLNKREAEDLMKDDKFLVSKQPSLFYPVLHLKMRPAQDDWPLNDIKVREAMDLALDRDEIINVIQDGEGNYNGPIQWPQVKWALSQEELRDFYKYDPTKARQLLEAAGYGNGFSMKIKVPKLTGPSIVGDLAVLVQDQLRRVKIDLQLDEVELGAFISSVILPGNFDMTFFPNLPYDEPDRPLSFYHSAGVTGTGNWTNYTNPDLDVLIEAQAEEFDEEERKKIITEAQRFILNEHGPQLTLTGGYAYNAAWSYVHFGNVGFFGTDPELPPEDAGPFGVDIWVDKA